ncbi:hypothetical protein ACMFKE_00680 [Staphylococcus haemolyticus]|uniref:hypothetical protein n=1 Tax=Staphylococcus haemolyticus TaxID=1283 RepID=UPI0039BD24D5
MKKFLVLLFTSFLILGACSNKDSSSENSNKSSINKSDKKKKDRSKEKKREYKKNSSSKENQTSQEQAHLQQDITQVPQQTQQNNLQSTSQEQSSQQKQQTNANNQQTQQRYDYDHNGVYRTPAEQKAHEQWIKDQVEWNKQNETRKQKLQDEYFNLSDKMYEDGVSKAKYNSTENVKLKY